MNTALQTYPFGEVNVAVIDHNQERWMTGEDIGLALEYSEPRKSINNLFDRFKDELEEYSVDIKLMSTDGKQYDTRVYNEEGVMMVCFFSKQPKAAQFRKWAVKILKAYRNQELVAPHSWLAKELEAARELLATQRLLIASQQAQTEFLQEQLKQSQSVCNGLMAINEQEEAKVLRLERARAPAGHRERREIAERHAQGHSVAEIARWSCRSTKLVRRILKEAGAAL